MSSKTSATTPAKANAKTVAAPRVGRSLVTMPAGNRDAMVDLVKEFVYKVCLARIKEHQEDFEGHGEYRFDPEEDVKGKTWDTFDSADDAKHARPVTIS